MSPQPGRPSPNPKWIVGDSDALLQLVATNHLGVLKALKGRYGIGTLIPQTVHDELHNQIERPKFKPFHPNLRRALDSTFISVLTEKLLIDALGQQASGELEHIEDLADDLYYSAGVGHGESYVHAIGIRLGLPVLSNDHSALELLSASGRSVPGPVLRAFDILVFGRQIGALADGQCDDARQVLDRIGDGIEPAFSRTSFTRGLNSFYLRLADSTKICPGSLHPCNGQDVRLTISPLKA